MQVKIRPPTHCHVTPPSAHPKQKGKSETKDISNPPQTFLLYQTEEQVGLQADRRVSAGVGNVHCIAYARALHCIALHITTACMAQSGTCIGGGGEGGVKDEDEGDWGAWRGAPT